MAQLLMKAEWKFVGTVPGEQCVMTSGEPLMLLWPVDSLDSLMLVWISVNCVDFNSNDLGFTMFYFLQERQPISLPALAREQDPSI